MTTEDRIKAAIRSLHLEGYNKDAIGRRLYQRCLEGGYLDVAFLKNYSDEEIDEMIIECIVGDL